MHMLEKLLLTAVAVAWIATSQPADTAPLGRATPKNVEYAPQKVLYDVDANNIEEFTRILDRVSYLNNLYNANPFDASIVLVLHGDEIPFFAIANFEQYEALMQRAKSLTLAPRPALVQPP